MFSETGDPNVTNAMLSYIIGLCSVDDTLTEMSKTIYVQVMTLWLDLYREKITERNCRERTILHFNSVLI